MSKAHPVEKAFCTTREAAAILGVSLRTAQLWVENGLLRAWKTEGGHRRIERASIQRLLAAPKPHVVAPPSPSPAIRQAPGERPLHVLVVEDDVSLLRLYELRIGAWPGSPKVTTVESAFEALVILGQEAVDLLIADLHMPGIDGFEMIRSLRQMSALNHLEIVVVTGLDKEEIAQRGELPEDVEVLPKPIPFARLAEIGGRLGRAN